jgi:hypothetical protein
VSVVGALERELAVMGVAAGDSTLAASALALAGELDSAGNSATSKSMCAKALLDVMNRLRELTPEVSTDGLDDLASRRDRRRAKAAG